MTDYFSAANEIFSQFIKYWNVEAQTICGYTPDVHLQNRTKSIQGNEGEAQSNLIWCLISQQTVAETQASFRNGECGQSYENDGLVFVQIFCPSDDTKSDEYGRKLAAVARDAFRGKRTPGGVVFRNARVNELPAEPQWVKFNSVAEYEYYEKTN